LTNLKKGELQSVFVVWVTEENIMVYQISPYNCSKILGCIFYFLYFPVAEKFNLFELSVKYF